MIQIKNLKLTHQKDNRVLLKDFQLVCNKGDKIVLVGEEGNGKSSLLKRIYQPDLLADYMDAEGERIIRDEYLGYLPQELPKECRELSVSDFLFQNNLQTSGMVTDREIAGYRKYLGLTKELLYSDQAMSTLSGGEKIKIQLLRILLSRPTVLLLDEPSNDIDLETLEWLEKLINGFDGIVLFVSHDETLIERVANRVIHIEQLMRKTEPKCTVANMTYAQYVSERGLAFHRQTQRALSERREEKKQMERFRKIAQSVEHAQNKVSRQDPFTGRLLKKKMKAVKSLEHRLEREHQNQTEIPEQEAAIFYKFGQDIHVPAGKVILDLNVPVLTAPDDATRVLARDITLHVRGPKKVCIVGNNGTGKTTLLKRVLEEMSGRNDINAVYMPQQYEEQMDLSLTPVEFLSNTGDKEEISHIRTYLGSMKYTADEMMHPIRDLSGGQRAKVMLLKISMSGADVLILDEPTRNLSPLSGPVIRDVLSSFGGAIVAVSHDRKFIHDVCDTVYKLTGDGLQRIDQG